MNKLIPFLLIIAIGPLLGSLYGVAHDFFTFSISPEYYWDFKFKQFDLIFKQTDYLYRDPVPLVFLVGVMATWWVGLIVGVVLACVGLIHKTGARMFKITFKAFLLTLLIAFVVGLLGLLFGIASFDATSYTSPWIPEYAISSQRNFYIVGSMHNFSYLGGLIGLIVAVVYSVKQKN